MALQGNRHRILLTGATGYVGGRLLPLLDLNQANAPVAFSEISMFRVRARGGIPT